MDEYPPSFFDRLTDPAIPANRCRYTLRQVEDAVLRDLSDLLNQRRPPDGFFAGLAAVSDSIANFGIRDFSHEDGSVLRHQTLMADHIAEVIRLYEPRLTNVRVVPREPTDIKAERPKTYRIGVAYFRIVATLSVDPTPIEGVVFDTMLELSTGHHAVSTPGGGA